ncbi:hypothetical protein TIFTF001_053154 [Ficus carica]|uniref:Phosphoribosyltransferase domain-containing protein n=1 Tax=Ficus carica TaxID=3494 RepID=A0AA88EGY4_FICCA|nr:hypothetical protein TIFTF001_053154 [Ficus carica]
MENALRACCKGIKIGKILIHRERDNGQQKLPQDILDRHVLLLDPILGTASRQGAYMAPPAVVIWDKWLQHGTTCYCHLDKKAMFMLIRE